MPLKRNVDPSKTSSCIEKMRPRIAMTLALMGGTETMRAEGETFLPRYSAESDHNYRYRLGRAVLLNYYKRAVEMLTGKPFSKPVVTESMPAELQSMTEDVDLNGSNLNTFARNVFQDAMANGITHVLVEYPRLVSEDGTGPETLADERNIGARPYFCHIPHQTIIAAYSETVNGKERLTHVRLLEEEVVRDGFDESTITRIRVLEPGRWELWRKKDKRWEKEDEGVTSVPEIPLITFYVEREQFFVSRPPLMDLAFLNIAHWQSASDQRNILTVTRFPILAGSGLNDEESKVTVGPNKLLTSISKDGKYYYVEHTGAAIASGRQDLEDLKTDMAIVSVELFRKSGSITATEKAINTSETTSSLQDIVMRFGDFLERCFSFAAQFTGASGDSYGSIKVNSDFGLATSSEDLNTLITLRTNREISHKKFMQELKRRNLVSDDFDIEEDLKQLATEEDERIEAELVRRELLGETPDDVAGKKEKKDDDEVA